MISSVSITAHSKASYTLSNFGYICYRNNPTSSFKYEQNQACKLFSYASWVDYIKSLQLERIEFFVHGEVNNILWSLLLVTLSPWSCFCGHCPCSFEFQLMK